jgi:hypothetical protein
MNMTYVTLGGATMQTVRVLCSVLFIFCVSLVIMSCSNSAGGEESHDFPNPIEAIATNITLVVYSDGWGTVLDTMEMITEGDVVIDIEEVNPYSDPPAYYIYAMSDGFYTELYFCTKGETISVDLDGVPNVRNSMTGVIFGQQVFFADCYHANKTITLCQEGQGSNVWSGSLTTDVQGRWGIANLPLGEYSLSVVQADSITTFLDLTNTVACDHGDLYYLEDQQAYAPNIYLYPDTETDVSVMLDFPSGGYVTVSEPEYENGWNVHVTPDGFIDGGYDYLFYEAIVVMPLQSSIGWILDGTDLENEFRRVLGSLGFVGREIDDFVEHWVPRVQGKPWYVMYPQDAEQMSVLDISPVPDKVLRALFVIRPLNQPIPVTVPVVTPFERDRFTVVEWGVIGWRE